MTSWYVLQHILWHELVKRNFEEKDYQVMR